MISNKQQQHNNAIKLCTICKLLSLSVVKKIYFSCSRSVIIVHYNKHVCILGNVTMTTAKG